MIWRKVLGRTSILGGRRFDVVWTDDHPFFLENPFRKVSVLLLITFFKSSYSAKSLVQHINSAPQPAATTFAFSSFCFFFSVTAHRGLGFYYNICTVLQCGLPPLRPHCGEAPRADIRTWDARSTRPPHLFLILPQWCTVYTGSNIVMTLMSQRVTNWRF